MAVILSRLRTQAKLAARAAALGLIGTVFLLVGLGFLSVALWMIVAAQHGGLIAFWVLGGLYVLLGLACLALRPSATQSDHGETDTAPQTRHTATDEPWVKLAEGFATGMQAGRAARDRRQ